MNQLRTIVILALGACLFAACDHPSYGDKTLAVFDNGSQCPIWGCGMNAGELEFTELNLDGVPNDDDLHITGVELSDGTLADLEIRNSEFTAVDHNGVVVAGGPELDGANIQLSDIAGVHVFDLKIVNFQRVPSWADENVLIPAYRLRYREVATGVAEPLCEAEVVRDGEPSLINKEAVIMAGERYDPETLTVSGIGAEGRGWINLACGGSVLAKLKLNLHDPEIPQGTPHHTGWPARQAMIKMYTADYCGVGESFTVDGMPMAFENRIGTLPAGPTEFGEFEAIWNEFGAMVLATPRRINEDPDVVVDIETLCPELDSAASETWPASSVLRSYASP